MIYFVILLVAIIILSSLIITLAIYHMQFGKRIDCKIYDSKNDFVNEKQMIFQSGQNRLTGWLYYPKENQIQKDRIILFIHGYGVTHKNYMLEIYELVYRGYIVFSYDMTGCGESEGDKIKGFSQFIIDAQAAIQFLKANFKEDIMIMGHSTGGYAAGAVLNIEADNLCQAIIISGFNNPSEFIRICMQKKMKCYAYLLKIWIEVFERKQFKKYASLTAITGIQNFQKPVLVLQGDKDNEVELGASLYQQKGSIANNKVFFQLVKNAGNFLTRKDEKTISNSVFNLIEEFITQDNRFRAEE